MPFTCPQCNRTITNRRIPNCTWCEAELPKELLLNQEQKSKLDKQAEEEKKRHETYMRKPSNTHSPAYGGASFELGDL